MGQTADKIKTWGEAKALCQAWKENHLKIVFTNGCFDIIHLGHVDYLERARQFGNKLVVGINTDASVARNKGVARPIQDERARTRILAAMAFVDAVILFEEDTPFALITEILPHVLVKGNDYLAENIVGADIVRSRGGEVYTLKMIQGYSTSTIINKIKEIKA